MFLLKIKLSLYDERLKCGGGVEIHFIESFEQSQKKLNK